MSTTLLVENNPELESYYSLNLQTWVGTSIIPKKEAKFCAKVLEEDIQIDLIITKARNGLEKSAELIQALVAKSGKNIPIIIIGKSPVQGEGIVTLPSGLDIKELIQNTAKSLNVTAQDMAKFVVPEYFPIPINYFLSLKRSVTAVYEEDIDNEGQYLQKLAEYQEFDQAEFDDVDLFAKQRLDLQVAAISEQDYYAKVSSFYKPIQFMAWLTALLIASGALFGGLNTFYAAVESRKKELATLQAIGFQRSKLFLSLYGESLLIHLAAYVFAISSAMYFFPMVSINFGSTFFTLGITHLQIFFGFALAIILAFAVIILHP